MDEPLSNLDAKLRVQMRAEIAGLQRDLGVTTLYVTHDQVEAMTMGDRVAVMKDGLLQQVDTPQELYDHPDNVFVAGFIGSPSMNLFESRSSSMPTAARLVGSQRLTLIHRCSHSTRAAGLRRQAADRRHSARGLRRPQARPFQPRRGEPHRHHRPRGSSGVGDHGALHPRCGNPSMPAIPMPSRRARRAPPMRSVASARVRRVRSRARSSRSP